MRRLCILWVVCGIAIALPSVFLDARDEATAPAAAGEATLADDVAINAQIEAAMKERRELQMNYYRLRARIERSDEIAALRKAANDAHAAAAQAEQADPGVMAARKAEADAYAAIREIQAATLKANPEAKALMAESEALDDKHAALSFRAAVAELKLTHRDSPIRRALAKDPKFAKVEKPSYRIRDRAARAEAYKAYEAARAEAMANLPEAKALLEEIKTVRAEMVKVNKAIGEVRAELMKVRGSLGRNRGNDALTKAHARSREAQKAVREAYKSPALKAAGEARDAAGRALSKRMTELAAEDEEGSALAAKIAALDKEIRALEAKVRKTTRKGATRDSTRDRGATRGAPRSSRRPAKTPKS